MAEEGKKTKEKKEKKEPVTLEEYFDAEMFSEIRRITWWDGERGYAYRVKEIYDDGSLDIKYLRVDKDTAHIIGTELKRCGQDIPYSKRGNLGKSPEKTERKPAWWLEEAA